MRTSHETRLDFETRNIVIIAHDKYMVADEKDITWALEQGLIELVLNYFTPNTRITVYDMKPREITSTHAMRMARHYLNSFLHNAGLN